MRLSLDESTCHHRSWRTRAFLLLALGVAACGETVLHVQPEDIDESVTERANWEHDLDISRTTDSSADAVVTSMISDRTPTVRYAVAIRIRSIGVLHVTTQDLPDDETEVLKVRLRAGDTPDAFHVDFDHSVYRRGQLALRFSGTTLLPRARE